MNSPEQPNQNRRIRVFVSSTFRDMMGERDELMTHAWPELRRFCRERQVELVEVDLRWGIAEEQSTRKETLKLCLDEIRACRPFFIGLLGERYGWVPGGDAFTADLLEEQPWLAILRDRSVTELEIVHGVLREEQMHKRAFFYFRDPRYLDHLPPGTNRADFESESPEAKSKLNQLKQSIRHACDEGVCKLHETYPDPVKLAALVLEDLKAAIESQFPIENIPDPLTREARDHEAFAETRRRTYIGRPDYFEALDRHSAGDDVPLVLLGDSGSGKSALLANWLAHWHTAHPKDLIFQHYIGGTPDSAEHWRLMTRLVAEIKRWSGDPDDVPRTHDDLLRDFPVWLAKSRSKAAHDSVRFIVVLDALNQLDDRDHARTLGWLPSHPFNGALRLIVSTLPGDTLEGVKARGWQTLRVEPLTEDERRRMIAHYLGHFGKRLDEHRLEQLAAAPASANPLYLKILLDELRVTGTHELLDERLNDYLSGPDIPALLKKVLARYQRDYERDRPGLVSETLGLIWAARRGLTENELLRLLRPADKPQLAPAIWNPLRASLEDTLIDRAGILSFSHDFLRAAVETTFVPAEDNRDARRLRLADFFETEPVTARSCDELPWLLQWTKKHERLQTCLLDLRRFMEILGRDPEEFRQYWIWLNSIWPSAKKKMAQRYLAIFKPWAEMDIRSSSSVLNISATAEQLVFFLNSLDCFIEAEQICRIGIRFDEKYLGLQHHNIGAKLNHLALALEITNRLEEAELCTRRALSIDALCSGNEHPDVARDLNNLAGLLNRQKRYSESASMYQRALSIFQKCHGENHSNVATVLNNLGNLLEQTKRFVEAEKCLREGLVISEQSEGVEHPNVAIAHSSLGVLLSSTGRWQEAEAHFRTALTIDEKVLGKDHLFVAMALYNLADLLRATHRLREAEVMMLRSIQIACKVTRAIGRVCPNFELFLRGYGKLLAKQGLSEARVYEELQKLCDNNGVKLAFNE